jgi:hypothetical protein
VAAAGIAPGEDEAFIMFGAFFIEPAGLVDFDGDGAAGNDGGRFLFAVPQSRDCHFQWQDEMGTAVPSGGEVHGRLPSRISARVSFMRLSWK